MHPISLFCAHYPLAHWTHELTLFLSTLQFEPLTIASVFKQLLTITLKASVAYAGGAAMRAPAQE